MDEMSCIEKKYIMRYIASYAEMSCMQEDVKKGDTKDKIHKVRCIKPIAKKKMNA